MQLKELLKKTDAAQALSIHGNADIDITGIKTDSRQIKKNDLFIAVKGTQTDGHDYIPQAIDKGATVIAYQKGYDIDFKSKVVSSTIMFNKGPMAWINVNCDNPNNMEDVLQMIRVNCEGFAVLTRMLLPFIIKSKHGHIVNLSSTAADEGYSGGAIYCATKSFVEMFGDSIRVELIDKPVKVTNIKPGAVNTEFSTVRFKGDKEKADNVYKGFNPLYAEDIADNIEYVLTRKSHVQISSMTIMAENQGTATIIHREK